MTQILAGRSATEGISVGDATTTGACSLFDGTTTGIVTIANNSGRLGAINIGNSSGSGTITIDAGGSAAIIEGAGITLSAGTVGALDIAPSVTSGITNVAAVSTRTGAINIGHASSSGIITIDAGSSKLALTGSEVTLPPTMDSDNPTITASLFSNQTGSCNMFASSSRTGTMSIGHASSSGTITIDSGSSNLNLLSDTDISLTSPNHITGSWTPILYDSSLTDTATLSQSSGQYARYGNTVFVQGSFTVSSKGTLTTTERIIVGGLPFAVQADGFNVNGVVSGSVFHGSTYTAITASTNTAVVGTTAFSFLGIDPPNSDFNDVRWSDVVLGNLCVYSLTYIAA